MKRFILLVSCIIILILSCSCALRDTDAGKTPDDINEISVVAVNFPAYDFARAICGAENVYMLLPPGAESHSYEPTARDILRIQECDLFIYTGGESDAWVERILASLDREINTLKMMDSAALISIDDHDEYDEHVWTSPVNAAAITEAVRNTLCDINSADKSRYEANAQKYIEEINALHSDFIAFFDTLENKTLIFGDRFPLIYFTEEYGIEYHAAFPGCAEHSEPSASDIAELMQMMENENISDVYHIEFSDRNIAESLAEAGNASTHLFYTCHNVSKDQLENGATYVSLMRENLEMLKHTMR